MLMSRAYFSKEQKTVEYFWLISGAI
jgi:hypothetical protein